MPQTTDMKSETLDESDEQLLPSTQDLVHAPVYSAIFTPIKLKALIEELNSATGLNVTALEIEKTLAQHGGIRWFYRIQNYLAMTTIPTYVFFQIKNSDIGFEQFLETLDPGIMAPSWLSYSIGVFTSCVSAALFALLFSSKEQGYLSAVHLAYLPHKLSKTYHSLIASPGPKLLETAFLLCHLTVLININVTGAASSVVDIFAVLYACSPILAYMLTAVILYLGQAYNGTVMNEDYYKGITYLFDRSSSSPSLLQEIREGNFAIPFQILFQDLSTLALRMILYCFLAEASSNALGAWTPSYLIAVFIFLHGLFVFIPKTHQFYLADKKAMTDSIQQEIASVCKEYSNQNPRATPKELKAENRKQFLLRQAYYKSSALPQKSFLFLLKANPLSSLSLLTRAATGGWIGGKLFGIVNDYTNTGPIIDDLIIASGVIAVAALLGGLLYRAEADRLIYHLINERIEAEKKAQNNAQEQKEPAAETVKRTACESLSDKAAFFINVINSISIATSNTGLINRLLNLKPELIRFEVLLALGMLLSIDAATNRGIYNQGKVKDTARRVFVPNSLSSTPSSQRGFYENARDTARKIFASSCCVFFQASSRKAAKTASAQSSIQIEPASSSSAKPSPELTHYSSQGLIVNKPG